MGKLLSHWLMRFLNFYPCSIIRKTFQILKVRCYPYILLANNPIEAASSSYQISTQDTKGVVEAIKGCVENFALPITWVQSGKLLHTLHTPCSIAFYTTITFDSYIPPTFSYRECFYYLYINHSYVCINIPEKEQ